MDERLTLRQRIGGWWVLRKLKRVPVYRAALDEVRRLMNNENFNKFMSEKQKVKFAHHVLEGLGVVSQAPNAVLANRKVLCTELLECAHYGVLLIPAAPEVDTTGLRGQVGITGHLRGRLQDALRKSENFQNRLGDSGFDLLDLEGMSDDEAYNICYICYLQGQSSLCVFDKVRSALNDHIEKPGRDWLLPTLTALYVWEEALHRQSLGLPEAEGMDPLQALRASGILNIMLAGAKNPLYEWEKQFEQKFPWRSSEEQVVEE